MALSSSFPSHANAEIKACDFFVLEQGLSRPGQAISSLLEKNPHVEKFYPAPQMEGGGGATIAELKI